MTTLRNESIRVSTSDIDRCSTAAQVVEVLKKAQNYFSVEINLDRPLNEGAKFFRDEGPAFEDLAKILDSAYDKLNQINRPYMKESAEEYRKYSNNLKNCKAFRAIDSYESLVWIINRTNKTSDIEIDGIPQTNEDYELAALWVYESSMIVADSTTSHEELSAIITRFSLDIMHDCPNLKLNDVVLVACLLASYLKK